MEASVQRLLLALPCLLLLGAAEPQRYVIDSEASTVSAKVPFFGLASKTAKFPKLSGEAALPGQDPAALSLDITIDARTLQAPDAVTRSRLKGEKFFWVERHPTVRFAGRGLAMRDADTGAITGKLTARGVTRPVTLLVDFDTPLDTKSPGEPIALTATTTIDRRDFGMKSYALIVGRKVDITIRARMVPR